LEKLITISALFFNDNENTLIIDSTWLSTRMYRGGYKIVHDKKNVNFGETRKLHIGCLKNSKIIAFARATAGEIHDNPVGREIIQEVANAGFNLTSVLADAGYRSKETYALCKELGILDPYINFTRNVGTKRAKSDLWQERVKMWKEQPEIWHEAYRYRVLVEGVFSTIKRKQQNWLRSKNELAQDIELLLKCLVYNLTVIGKYS
jgi:transposase